MLHSMMITEDDISYAEKILLKEWEVFDDERRFFIKNLETIDLQAVPWSWKTTALLAKLLILERKMPFSDGSGILVLSHTNTAVDEIKEKLEKIAPRLFKFPNFIWTIQSFVDEFLAKPYYVSKYKHKIDFIDTEIYNAKLEKEIVFSVPWFWIQEKKNALYFLMWMNKTYSIDFWINAWWERILIDKNTNSELLIKRPKIDSWNKKEKDRVYQYIFKVKDRLLKQWYLSYEDAYCLSELEIIEFPKIIKLLQGRFGYIFVDEMQDMWSHQIQILERIFYENWDSTSIFQRIWDSNQAIYDGKVEINNLWKGRDIVTWDLSKKLQIIWTHRLTQPVANIVKYFGLEYISFDGKRKLVCWWINKDIKPILLIYKTEHLNCQETWENKILWCFSSIIQQKKDEWYFQEIKDSEKFVSKAIIWNAKPQEKQNWDSDFKIENCRAKHYFFDYDVIWWKSKNKSWFKSEKDYLYYYNRDSNSLKGKYKNITNLFLRILRNNNIKNWDRYYTITSFLDFLKQKNEQEYLTFKEKLYNWSRQLSTTNIDILAQEMDDYFFDDVIKKIFSQSLHKTIFSSSITSNPINVLEDKNVNVYRNDTHDFQIQICTVHSVKWETHTCTLYLESSNSWYEYTKIKKSSFLWGSFKGSKVEGQKAMKMMYVWLSRPTHLLCYAIHEDRYNDLISWEWDEVKIKELWDVKFM